MSPASLETDADAAARAALAGRLALVSPVEGCPEVQPIAPLIVVVAAVALAAGFGITWTAMSSDDRIRRDAAYQGEYAYETLWGFVPVVGSLSQVLHGRTRFQRGLGTVFLMIDATMVGGVVKGLVFAVARRSLLRVGMSAAGRVAVAGSERVAEEEAARLLLRQGARVGSKEEIAEVIRTASNQGPVVLANSEGWLNHSVTYIIKDGKIWRLEGGPSKLFFRREAVQASEREIAKVAGKANTMSVYRVGSATAEDTLTWWSRQLDRGRFRMFLDAEGCAGSQAMLLNQIGRGVPGMVGTSRFLEPLFPLFLDLNRMGGVGTHIIANPLWQTGLRTAYGTAWQAGMSLGTSTMLRDLAWLPNFGNNLDIKTGGPGPSASSDTTLLPAEALLSRDGATFDGVILDPVNPQDLSDGLEDALPWPAPGRLTVTPIGKGAGLGADIALPPELADVIRRSEGGGGPAAQGPAQGSADGTALDGAEAAAMLSPTINDDAQKVLRVARERQALDRTHSVPTDEIFGRVPIPTRRAVQAIIILRKTGQVRATFSGQRDGLPWPTEVWVN